MAELLERLDGHAERVAGEESAGGHTRGGWLRRGVVVASIFSAAALVATGVGRSRSSSSVRIDLGESRSAMGGGNPFAPFSALSEGSASAHHAAKMGALHTVALMHGAVMHGAMLDANATGGNGTMDDRDETAAGFTGGQNGTCLQPPHLHAYFVNQLFWTWVHTLEVSGVNVDADGKETTVSLGHVKAEPFSFVSKQTWKDADGAVITKSHQDAISTVTNIYVDDCEKHPIATVSEQLAPSSAAVSQYTIQNKDGDIMAISTMSRNFGTEVDINDQKTGKRLVTVSKGWGQFTDAWSATFREGQEQSLANEPRVIVMLLAAASSTGSWGLGGPMAVMLNPIWLLLLFCCCFAGCTAYVRAHETQYDEIPSANSGGPFFGNGYATGYGTGGGTFGGTQYV